jgi:hypothetical protein
LRLRLSRVVMHDEIKNDKPTDVVEGVRLSLEFVSRCAPVTSGAFEISGLPAPARNTPPPCARVLILAEIS